MSTQVGIGEAPNKNMHRAAQKARGMRSIRNVGEITTELEPGHHTHTATYTQALLYIDSVLTGAVGYVNDLGIQEGQSSPLAHVVLVLGVVALHCVHVVLGTSLQVQNIRYHVIIIQTTVFTLKDTSHCTLGIILLFEVDTDKIKVGLS